jgi:hypothetical protein
MQVYAFTFTLDQLVEDEAAIDEFYGRTGDVTMVDSDARTELQFDRQASTLDEALRSAWCDVQASGWKVASISVEPASVALAAASE